MNKEERRSLHTRAAPHIQKRLAETTDNWGDGTGLQFKEKETKRQQFSLFIGPEKNNKHRTDNLRE